MGKPEPKRPLLNDQPFLSRLDALDRELRARSDGGQVEPEPAAPVSGPTSGTKAPAARPPAAPVPGSLTYEPFFGLHEKPFSLASDPRFLFRSAAHREAAGALQAAIRRREGIAVLTGDIGTGKTTLCRMIVGQLDRQTFTARVDDPYLSFDELLRHVLIEFGVVSAEEVTSGRLAKRGRHELTLALQEFLRSLAVLHAFAVVIVDEAQNVSAELLEHLRILADLGGSGRLLQVVLVGQPDLLDRLGAVALQALNQRIAARAALGRLDPDEVGPYIEHRLSVAGGSVAFSPEAIEAVASASHGVPRVVNLVCDRTLTLAAEANTKEIDADTVVRAGDAVGFPVEMMPERRRAWSRRRVLVAAVVVLVVAAAVVAWFTWQPLITRGNAPFDAGVPPGPTAPPLPIGEPLRPIPPPAESTPVSSAASETGDFAIQVGTFRDADRADRLIAALRQGHFRAYRVPVSLGDRGVWQAVLLGRYADETAARTDLQRLQAGGDYAEARVLRIGGQ
ncbi:MAG TPA: AAA family ATPase [Vicinamibacterales bacterium]